MGASATKEQRQKLKDDSEILQRSWGIAMKNRADFAVDIFYRVFQESPGAKEIFGRFHGIPMDELRNRKEMKAHCLMVNGIMDSILYEIKNEEVAVQLIRNVTRSHGTYHKNIDKNYYTSFGKALLDALKHQLKGQFDSKTEAAWKNAWLVMEDILLSA